jgi:hypothetical protein
VPGATLYEDARQGAVVDLVLGEKFSRLSTSAELARTRQGFAPAATAPAKAAKAAKAANGGAKPTPPAGAPASPPPSC